VGDTLWVNRSLYIMVIMMMEKVLIRRIDEISAVSLDTSGFVECGEPCYLYASYGIQGVFVQPLANPNDPSDIVYRPVKLNNELIPDF